MRYLAILLALTVSLVAMQDDSQPPEHRDDKYMDDPHAVCMRPEVKEYYDKDNPSVHACTCKTVCITQGDGSSFESMSRDCALDCTKTRCGCHPDENACAMGPGMKEKDDNPFDTGVVPR